MEDKEMIVMMDANLDHLTLRNIDKNTYCCNYCCNRCTKVATVATNTQQLQQTQNSCNKHTTVAADEKCITLKLLLMMMGSDFL